jgi:hypothetical protein
MRERARAPLAHDEMRFDTGAVQHLEETNAEDRSGSSSDPYYESRWVHECGHFATKKAGR